MNAFERQMERVAPHIERLTNTPDAEDLREIIAGGIVHTVQHPGETPNTIAALVALAYDMGVLRGESKGNIFEKMVVAGE